MSRNKYTKEFRDSTVQLVLTSGESVQKVSRDLGVNESTLHNWISAYKSSSNGVEVLNANDKEELKRLRKENALLKQEREILKKAAAYFAKETL